MEPILFIVSSFVFGILCSIPGLAIERYLKKRGIVRSSPWLIIVMSIVWTFGGRILFPEFSLISILLLVSVVAPFININEIWFTMKWGRWWWLKTDGENKKDTRIG